MYDIMLVGLTFIVQGLLQQYLFIHKHFNSLVSWNKHGKKWSIKY